MPAYDITTSLEDETGPVAEDSYNNGLQPGEDISEPPTLHHTWTAEVADELAEAVGNMDISDNESEESLDELGGPNNLNLNLLDGLSDDSDIEEPALKLTSAFALVHV